MLEKKNKNKTKQKKQYQQKILINICSGFVMWTVSDMTCQSPDKTCQSSDNTCHSSWIS